MVAGAAVSSFVLRRGVYIDVVVDRQTGAVPAGTAARLTDAALPRLP